MRQSTLLPALVLVAIAVAAEHAALPAPVALAPAQQTLPSPPDAPWVHPAPVAPATGATAPVLDPRQVERLAVDGVVVLAYAGPVGHQSSPL